MRESWDLDVGGETVDRSSGLKPMPIGLSLLFFGIPAVIGVLGLYVLLPALSRAGVPQLWNYTVSLAGVFPLLLAAALIAYRIEGHPLSWLALKRRFRLAEMGGREWLWTAGLLIVFVGGQILLMPTARWLVSVLPLPVPAGLPHAIDPRVVRTSIPTEFLGVPLRGNWAVALWYSVILGLNIIAEEFWWRGYVLPRQELSHSKGAWIVHGMLWTLFHVPMWWNLIALLPSTLSLSFVTSRLKNTTPGIVVHLVNNGFVIILLGIFGVGA